MFAFELDEVERCRLEFQIIDLAIGAPRVVDFPVTVSPSESASGLSRSSWRALAGVAIIAMPTAAMANVLRAKRGI